MGGSVSITAPKKNEKTQYMKRLMKDHEAMSDLFSRMSQYGREQHMQNSCVELLSIAEVLLFIEKEVEPEFSKYFMGMIEMLKESFYFIVGYKKGTRLEIPSKKFPKLLCTILMFSHLWQIFAAADDHIGDDSIFVGEFIRAKQSIRDIDGVDFGDDVTDEVWRNEFNKIDHGGAGGGDGWISFREFARYCCKRIVSPEDYCKHGGIHIAKPDITAKITHVSQPKQIDFGGAIQGKIKSAVPSAVVSSRKSSSFSAQMKNKSKMKKDILNEKHLSDTKEKKKRTKKKEHPISHHTSHKKKGTERKELKLKTKPLDSSPLYISSLREDNSSEQRLVSSKSEPAVGCHNPKQEFEDGCVVGGISTPQKDFPETLFEETAHRDFAVNESKQPIDVIAEERKEEEATRKMLASYVRPLYRPRSAADIGRVVDDFQAWVDTEALREATCNSWVAEDDAFSTDDEPIAGFGIAGINMVTFAYDMNEVEAEATAHKKYLYRKKPKGNLWDPKRSKKKFQRIVN